MFRTLQTPLLFMIAALSSCTEVSWAEDKILFSETFRGPLSERWKQVKFHDPTDYRIVTDGSNACLKAFAAGGCSAFATKVDIQPPAGVICSWRWKIDHCPKQGTDKELTGFDHAARVFVVFDTWPGPPRTINYIWANQVKTNATFNHPYSSRTKFIAVQSGDDHAGHWITEQRDLRKDWDILFKGEAMPKIVGVGVFTDSHYTRIPLTGWYSEIVLKERAKETNPGLTQPTAVLTTKTGN